MPNPKGNVHFWFREIYYFIMHLPKDTPPVTIDIESPTSGKQGDPDRTENEIRKQKGLKEDIITREDAIKACSELYEMLGEFLDDDVRAFMDDPRCAGARPRIVI